MRAIVLTAFLLASSADAQQPEPPLPGLPDHPLAAVVLIIPASLYALGEFWTRVCEGSGNVYNQDPETGLWRCSGFPRPPQS